MKIYTITAESVPLFSGLVPEKVLEKVDQPGYYSLGAVSSGEDEGEEMRPAGFLQFFVGESPGHGPEVRLLFLRVPEEIRGRGAGALLCRNMREIAEASGIRRQICLLVGEDRPALREFLEKQGFRRNREEMLSTVLSGILGSPYLSSGGGAGAAAAGEFSRAGIRRILSKFPPEILEQAGLNRDPDLSQFSPDLSSAMEGKNGSGLLLLRQLPEGLYFIDLCQAAGGGEVILKLLRRSVSAMEAACSPETRILIPLRRPSTKKLLLTLCPGVEAEEAVMMVGQNATV